MISLIGLALIAMAEFIFDYKSTGESTNWSIFYFTSMYCGLVIFAFDIMFNNLSEAVRSIAIALGVYFFVMAAIELKYINAPWDTYIESVNRVELRQLAMYLLVIAVIIISIITWVKRRSRT